MSFLKEILGQKEILESNVSLNESEANELNEMLNEAAFNEQKIEKVVKLYSRIFSKKFGSTFKKVAKEAFKRKSGKKGVGIRYMAENGVMLRFNWDQKTKNQYMITSIDYWKKGNYKFNKPTRRVEFAPEANVVQILDKAMDALKTGMIKENFEAEVSMKNLEAIEEAKRTGAEKAEWAVAHGIPKSYSGSMPKLKAKAEELGLAEELKVFLGEDEENTTSTNIKKSEKAFKQEIFANPETVFDDIEDLTFVIAKKKWKSLIICGMGGIGKTFHVTKKLEEVLGHDGNGWHYHSGAKTAPFSFFKTVFMEKDDIIVWDEADSLLKNDDIIMMLKPALDTSGKHYFEYSSGTQNVSYYDEEEIDDIADEIRKKILEGAIITVSPKAKGQQVQLPSKFKFTGSMIFISNMRADKIEQAIMSRSLFIDVYLAERDVLKRIQMIGERKFGKEESDEILEALGGVPSGTFNNNDNLETADEEITYMTPEFARKNKPITVRSMEVAKALKDSGLSNWATLAAMYG